MKFTLGFSTCPNDTFIFDAMIHQKVDTEGLEFDVVLADVEEWNKNVFKGTNNVTVDLGEIGKNAVMTLS